MDGFHHRMFHTAPWQCGNGVFLKMKQTFLFLIECAFLQWRGEMFKNSQVRIGACSDHTLFRWLLPSCLPFPESPDWMLAVLRRDGNSRTLEPTRGCLHRRRCRQSCHNAGFKGEQIWSYGAPSLSGSGPQQRLNEFSVKSAHTHPHTRARSKHCSSVLRRRSVQVQTDVSSPKDRSHLSFIWEMFFSPVFFSVVTWRPQNQCKCKGKSH